MAIFYVVMVTMTIIAQIKAGSPCSNITFVNRTEWKARPVIREIPKMNSNARYVIIHHTWTPECAANNCSVLMANMQMWNQDHRHFPDIRYNFVIGGDGSVYVGRGWGVRPQYRLESFNSQSYSIAFVGKYNDKVPSDEMQQVVRQLIKCGVEKGYISEYYGLYGHRDEACDEVISPGEAFYGLLSTWDKWHRFGPLDKKCSNDSSSPPSQRIPTEAPSVIQVVVHEHTKISKVYVTEYVNSGSADYFYCRYMLVAFWLAYHLLH